MTFNPMEALFLNDKFSDVSFVVENQSFPAHKAHLAISCPYFETMLFGATSESLMEVIELKTVSSKVFTEVLRAVYCHKVNINEESEPWTASEVMNLVQVADEYQYHRLAKLIAGTISNDQINLDTVSIIYGVSQRLNCEELSKKCEVFVQRSRTELLSNTESFSKLSKEFIEGLMKSGVLDPGHEKVLLAISTWADESKTNERNELLAKIEWSSLPPGYAESAVGTLVNAGDLAGEMCELTRKRMCHSRDSDKISSVYLVSQLRFLEKEHLSSFLLDGCEVNRNEIVIITFRYPLEGRNSISLQYPHHYTIYIQIKSNKGLLSKNGNGNNGKYFFSFDKCDISAIRIQIPDYYVESPLLSKIQVLSN